MVTPEAIEQENHLAKMEQILAGCHPLVRKYIGMVSWDRGHSAGYEEVEMIARDMVYDLNEINEKLLWYMG